MTAVAAPARVAPADLADTIGRLYRPAAPRLGVLLHDNAFDAAFPAASAAVRSHGHAAERRVGRLRPRPLEDEVRLDDLLEWVELYGHEYSVAVLGVDAARDDAERAAIERVAAGAGCALLWLEPGEVPPPAEPEGGPPAPAASSQAHAVRVTVVRVDRPRGAARVGDFFDFVGSGVVLPPGGGFDIEALNAVTPQLERRLGELPASDWLERKPLICGADPVENIVMRMSRIPFDQVGIAEGESR